LFLMVKEIKLIFIVSNGINLNPSLNGLVGYPRLIGFLYYFSFPDEIIFHF